MPGCGIPGSKIHLRHQPTAKDIAMWIGIGGHRDDADNWFMLRGSLAGHGRRISYDFMGTNTQFFLQALPTSSSFVGRQAGGIDRHRMTALYADDGVQKNPALVAAAAETGQNIPRPVLGREGKTIT